MKREGRCTPDCEAEQGTNYSNPDWNPDEEYNREDLYCRCGTGSTMLNGDDGLCYDCKNIHHNCIECDSPTSCTKCESTFMMPTPSMNDKVVCTAKIPNCSTPVW